jgi:2-dehydropantoate 2-reductase
MRVCVIGAGAIGGVVGARLALAGEEVCFLVRNEAQRAALDAQGLTLVEATGETRAPVRAFTAPAEAGPQDAVILAVKAHQVRALVPGIRALFGPATMVLTLQNGLPWWYFQRLGGRFDGYRIRALDSDGAIEDAIEPTRILGGVVYIAGAAQGPARVRHGGGNRLPIGEPDGSRSARVEALSAALQRAGLEAPVLEDIRAEMWFKAWGNACFNSIGALTHATVDGLVGDPPTRALVVAMMEEIRAVAHGLGVEFRQSVEDRIAIIAQITGHKGSMTQDVEAGRALEIEALLGVLTELGRLTGVATLRLDTVYACARLLDKQMATQGVAFPPVPVQAGAAPASASRAISR